MATYRELLAQESPEMQARVAERIEETSTRITLSMLRDELNISQTELAAAMGVKQPSVARMEQADNDPRLSTLNRYVKALGGELSLDVTLPDGKRVAFHL
ncbi:helix-turn-helix domain-containing protein [Salmonella enterica subsp. diarizonae serovar Rough:-:-]|uniref:helix-turn-helix domain-containing protein n=1 Tax=Salmonella enterica TaxID=28901 RepID=UPI0012C56861|nr:helix-turn-helix domain-containing protein [Salmonella enterica]ECI0980841.1 helix-turn-helix domain-containing protein [Salmonella enterica subsp. enterica serovar Newport]EDQ4604275.1 helix-turn-helix domain-containing protein [Salmonella enterica subsp. arizonae]EEP9823505.1 helix-turn-helix domain-containing protein [Salmonella enterica subsp. diarizonae]EGO1766451.1 helix-turn-helix domain-containing protein [Salmonella enterica subsp. diarizonae serovar Rough:-:-]MCH5483855.1 helix-tu